MTTTVAARVSYMARQVHLTITPTPRTLAQSRLVLRELQKFGEIDTFLNMKYDVTTKNLNSGRSAIVIFRTGYSASEALKASFFTARNTSASVSRSSSSSSSSSPSPSQAGTTFTCSVTPISHLHHISMRQNPYYNAFLLQTSSIPVQDLIRTSDRNHAAPTVAHADCFTRAKKPIPHRLQERILHNNAQGGAVSLMNMWKEAMRSKKGITEEPPAKAD